MHEDILKPPRLRRGGTIKIIAPSSAATSTTGLPNAIKFIEQNGFRVSLSYSIIRESPTRYLTAGDNTRTTEIENAFKSDKVDGIMVLQGGAGAIDILNAIDYDVIMDHPKVFIGYSDITLLQLAFMKKAHLPTFQGPMLFDLAEEDEVAKRHNWSTLMGMVSEGKTLSLKNPIESGWSKVITPGTASGRLMGGNLTMFSLLVGTDYIPSTENKILFFEDVNMEPWMLDNILSSLVLKGILQKANGFVFGEFPNNAVQQIVQTSGPTSYLFKNLFIEDYINANMHSTIQDTLNSKIPKKPSFIEYACCHGKYITTIPLGIKVEINADESTIEMQERAVD
ncbi:LD-carboxypeptidase [Candidatus Marsarchaeota archaeon]|nr:LD-carboxypeptidase [Candidatus Marsarchaeota archaeon]MCL5404839.1 LD-carboxypeptidase [Candidatus Marsarchaeota archaeon]